MLHSCTVGPIDRLQSSNLERWPYPTYALLNRRGIAAMLNLVPIAVFIAFTAFGFVMFFRRRVPLAYPILCGCLGIVAMALWPFWPVAPKREHSAVVLSRVGSEDAAAYRKVIADGQLSRAEAHDAARRQGEVTKKIEG